MAGPRKLWKTEIVIWTEVNPCAIPPGRLVQMFENSRDAYMGRCHSELISSPYVQDDGPPEDFFGEPDADDAN